MCRAILHQPTTCAHEQVIARGLGLFCVDCRHPVALDLRNEPALCQGCRVLLLAEDDMGFCPSCLIAMAVDNALAAGGL